MAKDQLSKCLWIADVIRSHPKGITLERISNLWIHDPISEGRPLVRRTFISYKKLIFDLFHLDIQCDPKTYEYTINQDSNHAEVSDWIMQSASTNSIIQGAGDILDRIILEKVPSAGDNLRSMLDAIRAKRPVEFNYQAYTRTIPKKVSFEPYFVKIFKQRWYVVGRNMDDGKVKTYALDRMADPELTDGHVRMPESLNPSKYFDDAFGIIVTHTKPQHIEIKCDSTQAKYLRALPLHSSQQEMLGDGFSVFTYRMLLTADLLNELLSYGSRIEVLSPTELRTAIAAELRKALDAYTPQ